MSLEIFTEFTVNLWVNLIRRDLKVKQKFQYAFLIYVCHVCARNFCITKDLLCRYNIIYKHGRLLFVFTSISIVLISI